MDTVAAPATKTVNLGLQGGGSHGAFTWGVLDALLADRRIVIEGLSGTSAGAVNAVALASGWATQRSDPRLGARETLARVWDEIAGWGALGALPERFSKALWGASFEAGAAQAQAWAVAFSGLLSPYQANPLNLNPLHELMQRRIDFAAIHRPGGPRVFVSATHVDTGKAAIFSGARLTADAVAASACLPTLFQAVQIAGDAFWDGGYSVNPALSPLIASCQASDIVVVQINPLRRNPLPDTAGEILDRINELTFNASLLTQMRAIDRINRLIDSGAIAASGCKHVRLHRIDGGTPLLAYNAASKLDPDPGLIRELFHIGQEAARHWLARHFDDLGLRSTVDVARDYEDDTRMAWPEAPAEAMRSGTSAPSAPSAPDARGLRPWVNRVLRRARPSP